MDSKLEKLQEIFRDVFDDNNFVLTPNYTVANNPDWDSVAMVQILLATEAEFSIKFTTEEVANIKSVADILKKI